MGIGYRYVPSPYHDHFSIRITSYNVCYTKLLRVGAHQGYLICDMIQWLYTCDQSLIQTLKFGIVERQPEVRQAQLDYIKERFGDDVKITHFNDIDEVFIVITSYSIHYTKLYDMRSTLRRDHNPKAIKKPTGKSAFNVW